MNNPPLVDLILFLVFGFIALRILFRHSGGPPNKKRTSKPLYKPVYKEEKNTTIIAPSGKEYNIRKKLKMEPNNLVIPPEDDAFRK